MKKKILNFLNRHCRTIWMTSRGKPYHSLSLNIESLPFWWKHHFMTLIFWKLHRSAPVGRGLLRSALLKLGHLEMVVQGCVWSGSGHLHRWRLYNLWAINSSDWLPSQLKNAFLISDGILGVLICARYLLPCQCTHLSTLWLPHLHSLPSSIYKHC